MSYVPLDVFIDRSIPQLPVGLITSNGLTSAMRNPMYSVFGNNKIKIDYRPREYVGSSSNTIWEQRRYDTLSYSGPSLEVVPGYGITMKSGGTNTERSIRPYYADWGSAYANEYPYNHITSNHNFVTLAAIYVRNIANSADVNATGSPCVTLTGFYRYGGYSACFTLATTGTTNNKPCYYWTNAEGAVQWTNFRNGHNDEMTEETRNKWVLLQLYKTSTGVMRARLVGGQYYNGEAGIPLEGDVITGINMDSPYNPLYWVIHCKNSCVLGFQTFAWWKGNDGFGMNIDDITWTLFDDEQICKEYSVTGNTLSFNCSGGISWEIYSGGSWLRRSGGEWKVSGTRDFFTSYTVLNCPTFTSIRPVLRNTGVLNADMNGVLQWIYVGTNSSDIAPQRDYYTSRSYDDAKALFFSKTRTYKGTLARVSVFEEGTITNSREGVSYADLRREAFDTNFHNIFFRNKNDLTLSVTGYADQTDYAAKHPNVPCIVSMIDNNIAKPTSSYLSSDPKIRWKPHGEHIGWEAGCPDPYPTDMRTYPSAYRFKDLQGNPTNSFQVVGKSWAIPCLEETKQLYPDCDEMVEEYNYNHYYGFLYTVEQLADAGVTPKGFHFNAEDYNAVYYDLDLGRKSQYYSDPRYNTEYKDRTLHWQLYKGAATCYKARLARLYNITSHWATSQLSIPGYGYNTSAPIMKYMQDSTNPLLYYKGRPTAGMSIYLCISGQYDTNDGFSRMGHLAYSNGMNGVHLFSTWTCHAYYIPGEPNFVSGMIPMTISQHIAFLKAAFAMGSIHVILEFGPNSHLYPYWTGPIAVDEMQDYANYIENGINYLVPPSMARAYYYHKSSTSGAYVIPSYFTIWYGKDSSGDNIDDNTWICCRTLDKSMMFYGATTDTEERTVSIIAPTGQSVFIKATPFGEVTII